ncbi:DUF4238 domain-containing protein [Mesorhizobium sp.]|uniref:DUF4238 domain-containing protein n=1 Tax=Mesorhizobium sp. TaxID=1871066 RepID=UPI000FE575D9|nr:DUF4238 domain-containing protein [Mesorhizobium sp.]RWM07065.1 MAG: DUF4238 domain-containing protein [Mesorhizobium sp.]
MNHGLAPHTAKRAAGANQFRHNHYVPEWYQKRFLLPGEHKYWYLDLQPEVVTNGKVRYTRRDLLNWGPDRCFAQDDLYTTKWGSIENTELEQFFFGEIDSEGKVAVEYFADFAHPSADGDAFKTMLGYMTVQKLRTPKGLGSIAELAKSENKNVNLLLLQRMQNIYSAIWTECIWQIADASDSATKLIISDHPVTVYNRDCFLMSEWCRGYSDPDIRLVATHTYFPLSIEKVLVLTNLAWVRDPYQSERALRPNPNFFRHAMFKFTDIQTDRKLTEEEVIQINYVTKRRALRYVAAAEKEWLYPERQLGNRDHWRKLGDGYLFMPDPRHGHMGGEVIIGYKNGTSAAFGPYGHRPWQKGYKDPAREKREWDSLERFKAEWAAMKGQDYTGVTFQFASRSHPPMTRDSDEMHEHYLKLDAEIASRPGERRRRRRLRMEQPSGGVSPSKND